MAKANPAQSKPPVQEIKESKEPVIEFIGEGADKVKFTIDPAASRIRVHASGMVLTDY